MCGITGFCDFNTKAQKQTLIDMTNALRHRGPDDKGYSFCTCSDYHIGLGHRRLSILDLSSHGHQPMLFDDLEIVYNGEVYNFKEIRLDLEEIGYYFISDSDTEVILKAYHKWGIRAVDKFIGMFSIVIYDKKSKKLICLRDRAGVKPLYYYFSHNLFLFSSELKSFHQNQCFKKDINLDSLALFLQLGYIPQPHCIFKNTFKLKAGHYLQLDLKTKRVQEIKYWDVLDFYNKPKYLLSETEALEETERLFKSAFSYRMVSDVPVGVFLSGGYDSSVVASIIQSEMSKKIKTFTIGFYEDKYNEAPYAKEIASYLGTDHVEYYCGQKEALDIIPQLANIYDEPFADVSAIPTILVSRVTKQQVSVTLSADGGDEIFGGYNKYLSKISQKQSILSGFGIFGAKYLNSIARYIQNKGISQDPFFENKVAKLVYQRGVVLQKLIPYFSTPSLNEHLIKDYKYQKIKTNFDDLSLLNEELDNFDKMFALDYKTYMVDDVLHKVDRATMSVSLEGREPLLDHRIIEFVSRLPSNIKIKNGDKKWLLKQIVHKYLPREMVDRPKMGFGIPIEEWLRSDLDAYIEEYFSDKFNSTLCSEELKKIKLLFSLGRINYQVIWNILIFQMWYQEWM